MHNQIFLVTNRRRWIGERKFQAHHYVQKSAVIL